MAFASGPPRPQRRQIRRLLVANRGEIAARIINAARELDIQVYALTTANDTAHALHARQALPLPAAASYLDIDAILSLAKQHDIDAIHPGYGFLSESPDFAKCAWDDVGAVVVGPGHAILERTGDKLAAKLLAAECDVPTLPATTEPTQSLDDIRAFVQHNGLPIMLKAVDGGGGKGIRLVRNDAELENASKRAMAESPSHRVFVEKAAVEGFRHVEIQIVGDGTGDVMHLYERECSIQRRYQKIVELAPSTVQDRELVGSMIDAAVRMARRVQYLSLGTFEFLVNPHTREFFFLEVNPRLQVEHTITEAITLVDIVQLQLRIAQGELLKDTPIPTVQHNLTPTLGLHAVQLRVTAENVQSDWSLSIGQISHFRFPAGNGVRVDTALVAGHRAVVSADFDSLLAKIIVSASSWPAVVAKCKRALEDTRIAGVKTNLDILRAIVASPDFAAGRCDTTWLEANLPTLLTQGEHASQALREAVPSDDSIASAATTSLTGSSSSTVLLRKGDAWAIHLSPPPSSSEDAAPPKPHHLKLTRVLRNEFPSLLRAEIEFSSPAAPAPVPLLLEARASAASSAALLAEGRHRRGDAADPRHVLIPFPGRLVEVLVDEGDAVAVGQVVCVVQQMKMELEVRAKSAGRVVWVTDAEDGEDVAEGALAVELALDDGRAKL